MKCSTATLFTFICLSACLVSLENRQNSNNSSEKGPNFDFLHFEGDINAKHIIQQFKESFEQQNLLFGTVTAIQTGKQKTKTAKEAGSSKKASQAEQYSERDTSDCTSREQNTLSTDNNTSRRADSTAHNKVSDSTATTCSIDSLIDSDTAGSGFKSTFCKSGESCTPSSIVKSLVSTVSRDREETVKVDSSCSEKRIGGCGRGRARARAQQKKNQEEAERKLEAPKKPSFLDQELQICVVDETSNKRNSSQAAKFDDGNSTNIGINYSISSEDTFPIITDSSINTNITTDHSRTGSTIESKAKYGTAPYQHLRRRSRNVNYSESDESKQSRKHAKVSKDPFSVAISGEKRAYEHCKESSRDFYITRTWTSADNYNNNNDKNVSSEKKVERLSSSTTSTESAKNVTDGYSKCQGHRDARSDESYPGQRSCNEWYDVNTSGMQSVHNSRISNQDRQEVSGRVSTDTNSSQSSTTRNDTNGVCTESDRSKRYSTRQNFGAGRTATSASRSCSTEGRGSNTGIREPVSKETRNSRDSIGIGRVVKHRGDVGRDGSAARTRPRTTTTTTTTAARTRPRTTTTTTATTTINGGSRKRDEEDSSESIGRHREVRTATTEDQCTECGARTETETAERINQNNTRDDSQQLNGRRKCDKCNQSTRTARRTTLSKQQLENIRPATVVFASETDRQESFSSKQGHEAKEAWEKRVQERKRQESQQQHITITIPTDNDAKKYENECRIKTGREKQCNELLAARRRENMQRILKELKDGRDKSTKYGGCGGDVQSNKHDTESTTRSSSRQQLSSGYGKSTSGNSKNKGNAANGSRYTIRDVCTPETDCTPALESASTEKTIRNDQKRSINEGIPGNDRTGCPVSNERESIESFNTRAMPGIGHEFSCSRSRGKCNLRSASVGPNRRCFAENDRPAASGGEKEAWMARSSSAEIEHEFVKKNINAFLKWGLNTGKFSVISSATLQPAQTETTVKDKMQASSSSSSMETSVEVISTPPMYTAEKVVSTTANAQDTSTQNKKKATRPQQKGRNADQLYEFTRWRIECEVAIGRAEQNVAILSEKAENIFMALTLASIKHQVMQNSYAVEFNLAEMNKDQNLNLPIFQWRVQWELPGNMGRVHMQQDTIEDIDIVAKLFADHLRSGCPVRLQRPISGTTHRVNFNSPIILTLRRNRDLNGVDLDRSFLTENGQIIDLPPTVNDQSSMSSLTKERGGKMNDFRMYVATKRGHGEPPYPVYKLPIIQAVIDQKTQQIKIQASGHIPRDTTMAELHKLFAGMIVVQKMHHRHINATHCPSVSEQTDAQKINDRALMPPPTEMPFWRKPESQYVNMDGLIMAKIRQWKRVEKKIVEVLQFHFNPNQEPRYPLRSAYARGIGSTDPNMTGHVQWEPENVTDTSYTNGFEFWRDCRFCNTKGATHHFFIRCAHCDCEGHMVVKQEQCMENCKTM